MASFAIDRSLLYQYEGRLISKFMGRPITGVMDTNFKLDHDPESVHPHVSPWAAIGESSARSSHGS